MPRTEYIGAGCFAVKGRHDLILKGLLGTCVGVVLVDRIGQVGGLLHLLLPEPAVSGNPWRPESYASTGLPLFIETICKAGAKKENLEAFIAGGALIGKRLRQDLHLDIGGRTTDVVVNILNRQRIPIRKSETGGFYSMEMILDLNNLECNIKPLIQQPFQRETITEKPTADEIRMAIARLRPIPQIALKILRMIGDNCYNLQDVADEISRDQIITAKVLRLSNSAMMGWKGHIDSIEKALIILGDKTTLLMVVSASMELFFPESERGYCMCKGSLYHHAIGTAIVAEKLARLTGASVPAVAYTAGLMHDIGKIVLDHFVARNLPLFYRRTQNDLINLEEAESEILGIGHPEVGGILASLWSIPQNLKEAIQYHHLPGNAVHAPALTHIIYLADLITSRFSVSATMARQNADLLDLSLDTLGLRSHQLLTIVDSVPWNALDYLKP
jgi:putative nucleotidyltransferase with HDIG domain